MKLFRILLILIACGVTPMVDAMWGHLGKAALTRIATSYKIKASALKASIQSRKFVAPIKSAFMAPKTRRMLAGFSLFGSVTVAAKVYTYQQHSSHAYPFKPNGTLTIKNFAGSINVQGWDKEELEVKIAKEANTKETFDETRTQVNVNGDSECNISTYIKRLIDGKAVYSIDNLLVNGHPVLTDKKGTSASDLLGSKTISKGDSIFAFDDTKELGNVHYHVKVPHKTNVSLKNNRGSINLDDITGQKLSVTTNEGSITANRCHNLKANSSSGPITITNSKGTVQASTSTGGIKISGAETAFASSDLGAILIANADKAYAKSSLGAVLYLSVKSIVEKPNIE